jgi:DNA mismatch repair ATPase MutS
MLLTGSNMSGKTTFIRTVAINSILAQTLNCCFAKSYNAPFYKIYSSIRITDDLLENTSYYLQEVLTVKELIDASNDKSPCLFVLDEIFKGTNTIERISGGKAILSYLNKINHTVLVSTHDIELTALLEKDNYDLYHFSEQIENNNLFFDHKIKAGKLKTRNAIKILDLYKYPSEIIKEAKEIELCYFS